MIVHVLPDASSVRLSSCLLSYHGQTQKQRVEAVLLFCLTVFVSLESH